MWEPILPKGPPVNLTAKQRQCETRMKRLVNDLQRACADYEVPSDTTRVPYKQRVASKRTGRLVKRRGSRIIGYKRTGTLKKSWSGKVGWGLLSGVLVGEVRSSGKVAPYNVYVRDPHKQSRVMERRGWRTTHAILGDYWPEAERDFRRILSSAR